MSVSGLLADAAARIGGENGRLEAETLLAHVLGKTRAWLYAWPEHAPDAEQRAAYENMVEARARGEPIAYLTGHREFWSLDLLVTRDVLIPRHETELAGRARACAHSARCRNDGCGSRHGLRRDRARDRARAAARARACDRRERRGARGRACECGAAHAVERRICARRLVRRARRANLRRHRLEPAVHRERRCASRHRRPAQRTALGAWRPAATGSMRSVASSRKHRRICATGGWLLLEHGWDQASRVRELFEQRGFVAIASAHDDGGHERVTIGEPARLTRHTLYSRAARHAWGRGGRIQSGTYRRVGAVDIAPAASVARARVRPRIRRADVWMRATSAERVRTGKSRSAIRRKARSAGSTTRATPGVFPSSTARTITIPKAAASFCRTACRCSRCPPRPFIGSVATRRACRRSTPAGGSRCAWCCRRSRRRAFCARSASRKSFRTSPASRSSVICRS